MGEALPSDTLRRCRQAKYSTIEFDYVSAAAVCRHALSSDADRCCLQLSYSARRIARYHDQAEGIFHPVLHPEL